MHSLKALDKFYADKNYKYFPGCSIIEKLSDKEINVISLIREEMLNSNLFDKFVFLPESSYHMTVCDLLTYNDLNIFEKEDIKRKDLEVLDLLKDLDFNLNIEMELVKITPKKLILQPKNVEYLQKLNDFRAKVFSILNIANKVEYTFHISLSYKLEEVEVEENKKIEEFLKILFDKYHSQFQSIKINKPILVAFNDMSEFRDLKLGRDNLGYY